MRDTTAAGLEATIREYSCPPSAAAPRDRESGEFDYAGRGYPLSPPPVRGEL